MQNRSLCVPPTPAKFGLFQYFWSCLWEPSWIWSHHPCAKSTEPTHANTPSLGNSPQLWNSLFSEKCQKTHHPPESLQNTVICLGFYWIGLNQKKRRKGFKHISQIPDFNDSISHVSLACQVLTHTPETQEARNVDEEQIKSHTGHSVQ